MSIILVTNDDGIHSEGITALYRAMDSLGEVYVVAPEREQSAVAHALTLHRPLKVEKTGAKIYAINGTPTDCVILGVNKILHKKPALIVSGINKGGNLGDDITYSGTVAAAIEGTLLGIPSIAISLVRDIKDNGDYSVKPSGFKKAAGFAKRLAETVLKKGLPQDTLLNVNIPGIQKIKGVKLTKQGKRIYDNSVHEMSDPRGRKHYWIGGGAPLWEQGQDTDFDAVNKGFISITPVHLDLTNYNAIKYLKKNWRI
ncbi:MAG: 5'/3'-nucleotidase SurE [Nitrospirae bacterium]|nr:5'/3'-nucleotidase SurE [Nitrospirota bacterium]